MKDSHKGLKLAVVLHVAIEPQLTIERIEEIKENIIKSNKEVMGIGFHGLMDFDPNFPTQV